jgi:ribosomal protein L11 methyltransferase
LEAFHLTHAEALQLTQAFGGEISGQKKLPTKGLRPARSPVRIRERLVIVASASQRREVAASRRQRTILCIPAGMAFGTGDHATTATCLRLLVDISENLRGRLWEMLDLGTGTGILAIAARVLGARSVEALDSDASAVRIAKENSRLNGVSNVRARKVDVRRWQPARTWDVITANVTGSILIEVAAPIATAMAVHGHLVFSGILREQEAEVAAALRGAGFRIEHLTRIGKWVTGIARRSQKQARFATRSAENVGA